MSKRVILVLILGIISMGNPWAANDVHRASPVFAAESKSYHDLYICSMHPWIASEGESICPDCGMGLSKVHGHQPGTHLPFADMLYVEAGDPMSIYENPGKDRIAAGDLIPIKDSPYYEPMKSEEAEHDHGETSMASPDQQVQLWTCGMHPEVISDEPGLCPICKMELTPLKAGSSKGGGMIEIDPLVTQNIGVVTEKAARRDLSRAIRTYGVVEVSEEEETVVSARVSGWVEKLHAGSVGISVRKGQTLMEIYSPELINAQEELLTARRISAEKSGNDTGQRIIHEAALKKMEYLGVPDAEIDRILELGAVQKTVRVLSPVTGVVLSKYIDKGGYFNTGSNLLKIADLRKLWVIAQFYEYELPWVKTGESVQIQSPYDRELAAAGKIDFIYPYLNDKSRTAEVRILLANENLKFKPGMYLDVVYESAPLKHVISVSKEAVIRSGNRDLVFVALGEGKFEPREVHIGLETDEYYQILHNLAENEKVVKSAQFLLDSEAKLQEAIQKRLARRNSLGQGTGNDQPSDLNRPGHQH